MPRRARIHSTRGMPARQERADAERTRRTPGRRGQKHGRAFEQAGSATIKWRSLAGSFCLLPGGGGPPALPPPAIAVVIPPSPSTRGPDRARRAPECPRRGSFGCSMVLAYGQVLHWRLAPHIHWRPILSTMGTLPDPELAHTPLLPQRRCRSVLGEAAYRAGRLHCRWSQQPGS